jgi:hypothetical protein
MSIPIHPKQHLVMPRNFNLEPQQHQINRYAYRGHTFGDIVNPWILGQLRSTEQFNVTPEER